MEHGFIAGTQVGVQLWFQSQLWLLPLLICSATTTDPQLICGDTEEERESTTKPQGKQTTQNVLLIPSVCAANASFLKIGVIQLQSGQR